MASIIDPNKCAEVPKTIGNSLADLMSEEIADLTAEFSIGFKPQPNEQAQYLVVLTELMGKRNEIKSVDNQKKVNLLYVSQKIGAARKKGEANQDKEAIELFIDAN
jgi:hypothetical protein